MGSQGLCDSHSRRSNPFRVLVVDIAGGFVENDAVKLLRRLDRNELFQHILEYAFGVALEWTSEAAATARSDRKEIAFGNRLIRAS